MDGPPGGSDTGPAGSSYAPRDQDLGWATGRLRGRGVRARLRAVSSVRAVGAGRDDRRSDVTWRPARAQPRARRRERTAVARGGGVARRSDGHRARRARGPRLGAPGRDRRRPGRSRQNAGRASSPSGSATGRPASGSSAPCVRVRRLWRVRGPAVARLVPRPAPAGRRSAARRRGGAADGAACAQDCGARPHDRAPAHAPARGGLRRRARPRAAHGDLRPARDLGRRRLAGLPARLRRRQLPRDLPPPLCGRRCRSSASPSASRRCSTVPRRTGPPEHAAAAFPGTSAFIGVLRAAPRRLPAGRGGAPAPRAPRGASQREVRAMREEARDFRLISSALSPEIRRARSREERREAPRSGVVQTIHQQLFYTLELLKNVARAAHLRPALARRHRASGSRSRSCVTDSTASSRGAIPADAGVLGTVVKKPPPREPRGPQARPPALLRRARRRCRRSWACRSSRTATCAACSASATARERPPVRRARRGAPDQRRRADAARHPVRARLRRRRARQVRARALLRRAGRASTARSPLEEVYATTFEATRESLRVRLRRHRALRRARGSHTVVASSARRPRGWTA